MTKSKFTTIEKVKVFPKKQSQSKSVKIFISIFIALIIMAGLLSGLVFIYSKVYANQFYPGVKIAGIELGSKTKEEAKTTLDYKLMDIEQTELNLQVGDEVKSVKLADLYLGIDIDQSLNQAMDYGRKANFLQNASNQFKALYKNKIFEYVLSGKDEELEAKLRELAPDFYKEPKNATILVKEDDISVAKEEAGKKIDLEQFKYNLANVLSFNTNEIIVLKWDIIEPDIKNGRVEKILPQVEKIVKPNITFTDTEKHKVYTADAEEIASWLVLKSERDLSISVQISDDAIKNFVQESLSKNINKKMIDKKINAKTKAIISHGQDGRGLGEDKTLEGIKQILTARLDDQKTDKNINLVIAMQERGEKEIQPKDAYNAGGTPGLSEGKYIEINLSQQMLYMFNGESQQGAFRVSTGKWSMPTPIGTRYVGSKSLRAWSARYGLYMPYWMNIGGDYGIHELPEWPGGMKEGESHLGTPVSHGCVRLGVGSAAAVYNWTPSGTPVFIHK